MGNWTTVNIIGRCPIDELPKLKEFVNRYKAFDDFDSFHCLSATNGLCGLGEWASENINVVGNLAERDYSYDSVAEELIKIGQLCPNAEIKIHVGNDYESLECIKTVVLKNGIVEINEPEVSELQPIDSSQINSALLKAIMR